MKVLVVLLAIAVVSVAGFFPGIPGDFMDKIKDKIGGGMDKIKDKMGGGGGFGGKIEIKCQGEKIDFSKNEELKEASKVCDVKSEPRKAKKNEKTEDDNKETKEAKSGLGGFGGMMDGLKDMFKNFNMKDFNIKDMFKNFKPNACSIVCKGKAMKIINDDGKFDLVQFEKFVGNFVSENVTKSLVNGTKHCFTEQPDLIIKDDTCNEKSEQLTTLMKCIGISGKEVCDAKKQ